MPTDEERKKAVEFLKSILDDKPGLYIHPLSSLIDGNVSINKKGQLRISLVFPADEMIEGRDVRAVLNNDWKLFPFVLLVDPKEIE